MLPEQSKRGRPSVACANCRAARRACDGKFADCVKYVSLPTTASDAPGPSQPASPPPSRPVRSKVSPGGSEHRGAPIALAAVPAYSPVEEMRDRTGRRGAPLPTPRSARRPIHSPLLTPARTTRRPTARRRGSRRRAARRRRTSRRSRAARRRWSRTTTRCQSSGSTCTSSTTSLPSSRLGRASKAASPRRTCSPCQSPELKWAKEEGLVPFHSDTLILKTSNGAPCCSQRPPPRSLRPWPMLLGREVIWLPRERPNSSTSSDDGASKSASGGYRGVEPAVAVTCGSTTPRRLCL